MINDFYKIIGGSYDEVFERISNEKIINKFILKFLDDSTFFQLTSSINEKNYVEAFRNAHTLKGVCLNLGFGNLGITSGLLTELLRNNDNVDEKEVLRCYNDVKKDYNNLINEISKIKPTINKSRDI